MPTPQDYRVVLSRLWIPTRSPCPAAWTVAGGIAIQLVSVRAFPPLPPYVLRRSPAMPEIHTASPAVVLLQCRICRRSHSRPRVDCHTEHPAHLSTSVARLDGFASTGISRAGILHPICPGIPPILPRSASVHHNFSLDKGRFSKPIGGQRNRTPHEHGGFCCRRL